LTAAGLEPKVLLTQAVRNTNAWACYDCGKCSATCPLSRSGAGYSPRRQVLAANLGKAQELVTNGSVYRCLTCGLCEDRCPTQVDYIQLVQSLRELTHGAGVEPECPHGGALHSMMRMMAKGGTQQDRLGWLSDGLETHPAKGEVFFWTGCSVYYDVFFPDLDGALLDANRAALKLLNRLGITPVVSVDERCCGHDLLWSGDRGNFVALAKHNVELVAASGAKTLVTTCAECYRTWKLDYAPYLTSSPLRILHLSEFLAEHIDQLKPKATVRRKVTYHDPCRLGRHMGVYDAPRKLLLGLPGIEIAEMRHSREAATCCAGGTWSSCDRYSKQIQVDRLREARETGAEVLVTACPKCRIHFACAMKDPNLANEIALPMKDLAEVLDEVLV
jgi:Fe-S oxidoreductase